METKRVKQKYSQTRPLQFELDIDAGQIPDRYSEHFLNTKLPPHDEDSGPSTVDGSSFQPTEPISTKYLPVPAHALM